MVKVLVSNANIEENLMIRKFLTNENDFEIEDTKDFMTTINKYLKIEPDVFILDSGFGKMSYNDILNKIALFPLERSKCNTLLTLNNMTEASKLDYTSKIYRILRKPISKKNLLDTIHIMTEPIENTPKLKTNELNSLLLKLNLNISKKCSQYMMDCLIQCYYYPYLIYSLNEVFDIVALKYHTNASTIKEGLRASLIRLNKYGITLKTNSILDLLDTPETITPRFFIEVVTTYLHDKKK